ncbi:hypothetical protein AGDE_14851 [Angomonas deanei]|uniref:WD domain, G-beta repeat n=1 Tax=Angomonas deanei TaxID=59799 RepID=A0A7G2CJ68_9TRYP|nr:hypothetical protein AGDE_14851 [Angomonas deanei]CAD2219425.1 hypothetical protein, conserved [Angomonas deanei]|eukprot:EPY20115.1 hypothetical protein AGDE_14851 [Angomonas deanei]
MHYGPVYDLAVSASIQVVTGGHDGTCCVGDLAPLVRLADETAEVRWREKKRKLEHGDAALPWFTRFEHHTLPVVCVRCFSDGNSFLSLSVDGGIVVQQTTGDRPILLRTSCGFPSKCLTFSVDESYCIVGGTQCAAVDLNRNQRSDASFTPSDSEVRLLPFHLDDGDQLTHTLPANTFF